MVYCAPCLEVCLESKAVMGETQRKGDFALIQAIATFSRLGFQVSLPISDSTPYDLVVDIDEQIKRVQVKYTSRECAGLARIYSNSKGYVVKKYEANSYDWLYVLKADGREYLVKECTPRRTLKPLE